MAKKTVTIKSINLRPVTGSTCTKQQTTCFYLLLSYITDTFCSE